MKRDYGFTLVEFLMAMAVFSFMLLLVITGFINIVRLHNASVALNVVQDNAQNVVASVERDIRDGNNVKMLSIHSVCIDGSHIIAFNTTGANVVTSSAVDCAVSGAATALTTSDVQVFDFTFSNDTPSQLIRPTIRIALTVATRNSTSFIGAGASRTCSGDVSARQFCAVTTITGAATSRGLGSN